MAMRDHLDSNGVVTNHTIVETAKEQIATARAGQVEAQAGGNTYVAELLAEAVDMNLDRINQHK
jgi:hypothetical protein